MFVPEAQEWLHEFRWHGANPKDPRRKIPCGLIFNKLRVIPDQMYFDVEGVRTADDALLTVKLMIFFELIDIAVMLDQTHDVVADFINAVTADVIDFASGRTFERFKEQTEKLNARETYPQLAQRAGRIGYRINKVVYRGYEATPKLQAMHDGAIEMRTKLKLESETEEQAQAVADLKLKREHERAEKRQEMQRGEVEHENRMKQMAHEAQLRHDQAESEARLHRHEAEQAQVLAAARAEGEMKLAHREAAYAQRVAYLKSVRELEVDMTRFLVAKHERADKRIQIDGGVNGGPGRGHPQLHLHERA
jgi:hypothetical protein